MYAFTTLLPLPQTIGAVVVGLLAARQVKPFEKLTYTDGQ